MIKKIIVLTLLTILLFTSISAAVELDDFDKSLFVRVFKDVDSDDLDYMARLGLNSRDISLVLYYYSNSGKELNEDDLREIARKRERLRDFHRYFGMPHIIFDDDLIRFRHPRRDRHYPPLDVNKYDRKFEFRGGTEKIKIRGNNYDYKYNNRYTGVEEKIEIKKQKYEYYYKDENMIEMLDVHYVTNKYSYYYKNLNNGRTIKREGRGRIANKDLIYEELKERYYELEDQNKNNKNNKNHKKDNNYYDDDDDSDEDDDSNISFKIEIDLSDLFN